MAVSICSTEKVSIPYSVTSIGDYAFNSNLSMNVNTVFPSNLTLKIPKTVINLGSSVAGLGATIEVEFRDEEEIPDTWKEGWDESYIYNSDVKLTVIWAQ